MEFAEGNCGLLQGALQYAQDVTPPVTNIDADNVFVSNQPINYRFAWPGEAAYPYTTDGSAPTAASPQYQNQGARKPRQVLTVSNAGTTTVKWFGTDMKGNRQAARSQTFLIDQAAPTVAFTTPASEGAVYTQGRPVAAGFTCADEGGAGVASCAGSTANGSNPTRARRARSR